MLVVVFYRLLHVHELSEVVPPLFWGILKYKDYAADTEFTKFPMF